MNVSKLLKIQTIALPALLALAACSGDVDNPLANGPVALGVTAEIGQVMTRAQVTSFETNDAIGVIPAQTPEAAGAVMQYQFGYDGSKFNPGDARYYFADTNEKTFHAYYPYTTTWGADNTITLDTRAGNQVVEKLDEQRTWRKNDYLAATTTASASKPTATYTGQQAFRHVMTQVVLKFQAGGGLTDLHPLTSYTLTTKLAMDGTFSPATGAVTVDESKTAEKLTMGGLQPGSDKTFSSTLILLPQEVADGTLGLDVTYGGQTYRAALSLPEGNALTAGTSYAYTVTISQNGLSVAEAEIQNWNTVEDEVVALPVVTIGNKTVDQAAEGDFYFSDGTFADKTANLTEAQAAACIGVAFMVRQTSWDVSDYSDTGIQQETCRGYVLALTDAHQGVEGLPWADGGAETANIDGLAEISNMNSGYAYTQAIRKYAEANHKGAEAASFPAAYACLQYGTKDDQVWGKRFAAPLSSSGWFLPSQAMLRQMQDYRNLLEPSFTKLKDALSGDTSIGWFSKALYWSSMQWTASEAKYIEFSGSGEDDPAQKSVSYRVRAMLAF